LASQKIMTILLRATVKVVKKKHLLILIKIQIPPVKVYITIISSEMYRKDEARCGNTQVFITSL
ncbi:hypothetical protein U5N28_19520, partial [Lysinibacillus telephonicus]